jgi:hypothetical protein
VQSLNLRRANDAGLSSPGQGWCAAGEDPLIVYARDGIARRHSILNYDVMVSGASQPFDQSTAWRPSRTQLVSAFDGHRRKKPGFPMPLCGDLRLALPCSNRQPREIGGAARSGLHAHGPGQWNAENIGLELQQQIISRSPPLTRSSATRKLVSRCMASNTSLVL